MSLTTKLLNAYVDSLARGDSPIPASLEFYVWENSGGLRKCRASLPASGSLANLFQAFGLVSAEDCGASDEPYMVDKRMLSWLQDHVREAVHTRERHEDIESQIKELNKEICKKFKLMQVIVSSSESEWTGNCHFQMHTVICTVCDSLVGTVYH